MRRGGGARLVVLAVAVLLVVAGLRALVAEVVVIPSGSMGPTLRAGDRVLVDKLRYRLAAPRRDDLALFAAPGSGDLSLKRIVGVGGDRVGLEDGVLVVNGRPRREPFVDSPGVDAHYFGPVAVPAGHVFVLGDDRAWSRDSRSFGPVPETALAGRLGYASGPSRADDQGGALRCTGARRPRPTRGRPGGRGAGPERHRRRARRAGAAR